MDVSHRRAIQQSPIYGHHLKWEAQTLRYVQWRTKTRHYYQARRQTVSCLWEYGDCYKACVDDGVIQRQTPPSPQKILQCVRQARWTVAARNSSLSSRW